MRQRRKLWLWAACLVGGVGLLAFLCRHREPTYQGRSLSYWVRFLDGKATDEHQMQTAAEGVKHLGTNALPFLLEWIQFEQAPQAWRSRLADTLKPLAPVALVQRIRRSPRESLADGADTAFGILGERAAPAIPRLTELLNNPAAPETARRATLLLRCCGTNSLPTLLSVIDNPNHPCRLEALIALHSLRDQLGPFLETLVPPLISCLRDTRNSRIPSYAVVVLGQLGSAPQLVVPALLGSLTATNANVRLYSALALAVMGAPAHPGLPALTNALHDPDASVQNAAKDAIRQITHAPEP